MTLIGGGMLAKRQRQVCDSARRIHPLLMYGVY